MADEAPDRPAPSLFTAPAVFFEEILRLPDTMRQVRLFLEESVRALRQLNETGELLLRMARRWEEAGFFDAAARMQHMEETMAEMRRGVGGLMSSMPGAAQVLRGFLRGVDEEDTD